MADPFVAEIRIFGFNFAPNGWAFCDGQLLPISQNTALFSLVGTFYGGDGKSTFALPDLQGQAPMHPGEGAALTPRFLGETGGSESVLLHQAEMPLHSHGAMAATTPSNLAAPSSTRAFSRSAPGFAYKASPTADAAFATEAISFVGSNLPHNNMMPYITMNFCIALQGVFPPRG